MANFVKVKATAKGYHVGPREVGDVFDVPFNKDGTPPKSKWFTVLDEPKPVKASHPVSQDDDFDLA